MAEIKSANIQDVRTFLNAKQIGGSINAYDAYKLQPFLDKNGRACIKTYRGNPLDHYKAQQIKRKELTGKSLTDSENTFLKSYKKNHDVQFVTNATLRYDEWRLLDEAIQGVVRERLVGFDDLRRNNLVRPLGNAMATTVLTHDILKDSMEANINMVPTAQRGGDRPTYDTGHTPIPIVDADFFFNDRVLQESRNRGNGIDVDGIEAATRRVNEKLEDMLFGATASLTYGGGTLHTYLSEPNINTVELTVHWDDSPKTAEDIKEDVLAMKQMSINDKHFGPWMLYVPTAYDTVLDEDYKSTSAGMSQTIRERILQIDGIQGISVVDRLPADTVLLVQMTSDVVQLIDGMPITPIEYMSDPWTHNYKVMTIQVPRIRYSYDSAGNKTSGIVKLATP